MESVTILRTLVAYNYALYGRVWDSIMTLSDEQFVANIEYSHGSIRNQIVHVATVDARWLQGLRGQPGAREFYLDPADYPSRDSARVLWDGTSQQVTDYVDSLNETSLAQIAPGMGGPVWQVVAHLVNHGTDHRAQILRALYDFGAPTFDQDLVLYLWSP